MHKEKLYDQIVADAITLWWNKRFYNVASSTPQSSRYCFLNLFCSYVECCFLTVGMYSCRYNRAECLHLHWVCCERRHSVGWHLGPCEKRAKRRQKTSAKIQAQGWPERHTQTPSRWSSRSGLNKSHPVREQHPSFSHHHAFPAMYYWLGCIIHGSLIGPKERCPRLLSLPLVGPSAPAPDSRLLTPQAQSILFVTY